MKLKEIKEIIRKIKEDMSSVEFDLEYPGDSIKIKYDGKFTQINRMDGRVFDRIYISQAEAVRLLVEYKYDDIFGGRYE